MGSEMCIRDSPQPSTRCGARGAQAAGQGVGERPLRRALPPGAPQAAHDVPPGAPTCTRPNLWAAGFEGLLWRGEALDGRQLVAGGSLYLLHDVEDLARGSRCGRRRPRCRCGSATPSWCSSSTGFWRWRAGERRAARLGCCRRLSRFAPLARRQTVRCLVRGQPLAPAVVVHGGCLWCIDRPSPLSTHRTSMSGAPTASLDRLSAPAQTPLTGRRYPASAQVRAHPREHIPRVGERLCSSECRCLRPFTWIARLHQPQAQQCQVGG